MPNNPDIHFNTSSTGETENNEEILRPRGNMTLKAQLEANEAERAQIVARAKARFKELQAELEERRLNLKNLEVPKATPAPETEPEPAGYWAGLEDGEPIPHWEEPPLTRSLHGGRTTIRVAPKYLDESPFKGLFADTNKTESKPEIPSAPFGDVGPIAEPAPIAADTVADADIDEPNSQETEQNPALVKKIGRSKNFGKYVAGLVALFGVSVALGLGLAGGGSKNTVAQKTPTAIESNQNQQNQEKEKGIKDGYDQKGMWLSENKGTSVDFACAKEVAEVCKNDEREMLKYTAHNQSESFADYLANLPEKLQPEGFKGLTLLETERKLESLNDDEYDKLKQNFDETINKASTRRTTLNGQYYNAYMNKKDSNGPVNHENMQLVSCVTNENNLEATEFYWQDEQGHETGSMTIKMTPIYDESGKIISYKMCIQAASKNVKKYAGLEEIPAPETPDNPETPEKSTTPTTPNTPTPTPTPTPPTTKAPKDAENLERIDEKNHTNNANNLGTGELEAHQAPAGEETQKPTSEDYSSTPIVQNETSTEATSVAPSTSENNYSEDRGGANAGNAEVTVESNISGEQAATQNYSDKGASSLSDDIIRNIGI